MTVEHLQEGQKLTANGIVSLFEITLSDASVLRLVNHDGLLWQGNTYEGNAIELTGEASNSDGEVARPQLKVMNPAGIFKPFVQQGLLDTATVMRKRVLRKHIDSDTNLFQRNIWFVGRVVSVTNQVIVVELRDYSDGPNHIIPHRVYAPPMFPVVNLR